MEALKFIKWFYKKHIHLIQGVLYSLAISVAILFPVFYCTMFGFSMFIVSYMLLYICYLIRKQWKKYKEEQDAEAQAIVDKLSGNYGKAYSEMNEHEKSLYLLKRLQAGKSIP